MQKTDIDSWLFVQGITSEKWAMSPGPSIVAGYKGKQVDEVYVPGILLGFPSTKAAAKAAMRFHFDLAHMFDQELPPMVIDSGGNPRLLPTIAYGREPRTVILTWEAARQLAGEPLELMPGPELKIEGMKNTSSKLMPPSEHNIGWALPTLPVEVKGAYPDKGGPSYPSASEVSEASMPVTTPADSRSALRVLYFFVALAILVFSGLFVWKRIFSPPPPVKVTAAPNAIEGRAAGLALLTPIPAFLPPTVPPIGYGTLVVRSEPANAWIYVDGVLVSKKSPATVEKQIDQEVHKLVVKRKGYKTYTKLYSVEANARLMVDIKLEKGNEEETDVVNVRRLDFHDAKLVEVTRFMAEFTSRNFILSDQYENVKVTMQSEQPVTPEEAYRLFGEALHQKGLVLVKVGKVIDILPAR